MENERKSKGAEGKIALKSFHVYSVFEDLSNFELPEQPGASVLQE